MQQNYYILRAQHRNEHVNELMMTELRKYGETFAYTDTLWVLTTSMPYDQVYAKLKPLLHPKDRVLAM